MSKIRYSSCLIAGGLMLAGAVPVLAQGYPVRPVVIVAPVPPGGGVDRIARLIAARLTEIFKQRAEHADDIETAREMFNDENVQVDQEPIVVVASDAVWVSAFVRVPTTHTGHTDFGAIE